MIREKQQYTINNEDQAISLLKQLVEGLEFDEDVNITFAGWPKFTIKIQGEDFQGTIPTRIMPTLLDLQKEVYRTYCLATYGDDNLRRLTKNDREQLELVVKVDKGSSFFQTLLEDPAVKILTDALARMTPTQVTATVILFGLSVTSIIVWKMWLNKRSEDKELDHAVEMSQLEKEKMEVIAKAMQQFPMGQQISSNSEVVKQNLLNNLKSDDNLSVTSTSKEDVTSTPVKVSGIQAEELTKTTRETPIEKIIEDEFFLKSADFSKPKKVRISVERVSDNYPFSADVPVGVLDKSQIDSLKNNSWDKINIKMSMLVKESRGKYTSAKVISVEADEHNV